MRDTEDQILPTDFSVVCLVVCMGTNPVCLSALSVVHPAAHTSPQLVPVHKLDYSVLGVSVMVNFV